MGPCSPVTIKSPSSATPSRLSQLTSSDVYSSSLSKASASGVSSSSTNSIRHTIFSVLLLLLLTTSVVQACFIRNCPKGGKRTLDSMLVGQRQCMGCGPGNVGQCVGPRTCCSVQFGCQIGTPEAEVCQKENESTTPCYIVGNVCGSRNDGNCVANGICCDAETCAINEQCAAEVNTHNINGNTKEGKLLNLLERLLRAKSLD